MRVAEAVGRALVACGVDHVFGVVGSGNFHVTNAMVAAGARFVANIVNSRNSGMRFAMSIPNSNSNSNDRSDKRDRNRANRKRNPKPPKRYSRCLNV